MTLKEYLLQNLHNYDTALVEPIRDRIKVLENQIGKKAVYTVDEILTNDVNYPTLEDALNDLFARPTSGSTVTQNDIVSNVTLGGIPKGTTIAKGTELEKIITEMLITYIQPVIKLTVPTNITDHVGIMMTTDIECEVTEQSLPIQYVEFFVNGVSVHKETNIPSGATNFKLKYNYVSNVITTATSFYCEISDGKTVVRSNSATFNFVYQIYRGVISGSIDENTITESDVKSCGYINAQTGRGYTYSNIVANKQKVVYAYPKSYGALSSIKDGNGLTYEARDLGSTENKSFTRLTLQINGIDYWVYIMVKPAILLPADKFKLTFA